MNILIPAYEPGVKMIELIRKIRQSCNLDILIVDDGSGENYMRIFKQARDLGCTVLHHDRNLGKGAALKTGFRYLMEAGEGEGVVCADCDGQHSVGDICKVAVETMRWTDTAVLGVRQFSGKVPFKSMFGNSITRWVFFLSAGYKIQDTQTGLRGYPAEMLPWLCEVEGTRFEYELNVLLNLKSAGYSIREMTIQTIYENGNKGSHFRPVMDSIRVYLPFLKFSASSLTSGLLDFLLLLGFMQLSGHLLPSVLFSRVISSIFNYSCNKYLVFPSRSTKTVQSAPRYFLLVLIIMLLNYALLNSFTLIGVPLVAAKILTETVLFVFSYVVQKRLVFARHA
jgi:putative flippase GtrA